MNKKIILYTTSLLYQLTFYSLWAMEGQSGQNIQPLTNFQTLRSVSDRNLPQTEVPKYWALREIPVYKEKIEVLQFSERKKKKQIIKQLKVELARKEIEQQELAHLNNMAKKEKRIEELRKKLASNTSPSPLPYRDEQAQLSLIPSIPTLFTQNFPQLPQDEQAFSLPQSSEQRYTLDSEMMHQPSPSQIPFDPPSSPPLVMTDSENEVTEDSLTDEEMVETDEKILLSDEEIVFSDEEKENFARKRKISSTTIRSYCVDIPKIKGLSPRPCPERKKVSKGFSGSRESWLNKENVSSALLKIMTRKKVMEVLASEGKVNNNRKEFNKIKMKNASFWKSLAHQVRKKLLKEEDNDAKAFHRLYTYIKRDEFINNFISAKPTKDKANRKLLLKSLGLAFCSISRDFSKTDTLSYSEGYVFDRVIIKIYDMCSTGGILNVNDLCAEIAVGLYGKKGEDPFSSHTSLRGHIQRLSKKSIRVFR